MSITKSLERAIKTMATQIAHDSPFDKTRTGVVVGVGTTDNSYNIELDGVTYTNIPSMNNLKANIGDIVKVVVPTNNPSQMFIYSIKYFNHTVFSKEVEANDFFIDLDVVVDSETGRAISGEDMDFYNDMVDLGWISDVII